MMDINEAIKEVKNARLWFENSNAQQFFAGGLTRVVEAFDVAINAMEKQVPKKPNMEQKDGIGRPTAKCPACGTFFIDQYCIHCGQKIDWE